MFATRLIGGDGDRALAEHDAQVLRDRRARWFVWARKRLRLALSDHGGGRSLGEEYLAFEKTLSMRALRIDGTPVKVKVRHRDDWKLPSELTPEERERDGS